MRKQTHHVAKALERVVENPYLNAGVGLVLFLTGIIEAGDALFDDVAKLNVGAHHGVIVFGVVHMFKSLPAILIGLALVAHSADGEK